MGKFSRVIPNALSVELTPCKPKPNILAPPINARLPPASQAICSPASSAICCNTAGSVRDCPSKLCSNVLPSVAPTPVPNTEGHVLCVTRPIAVVAGCKGLGTKNGANKPPTVPPIIGKAELLDSTFATSCACVKDPSGSTI